MLLKDKLKYIEEEDSKYDLDDSYFEQERKLFTGSLLRLDKFGVVMVIQINRKFKLMTINGQVYDSDIEKFGNMEIINQENRGILFLEEFLTICKNGN